MTDPKDRELDRLVERLPRSISPQRDLWSGIAARIATKGSPSHIAAARARRRAGLVAAAAFTTAAAAIALFWAGRATDERRIVSPSLQAPMVSGTASQAAPSPVRPSTTDPGPVEAEPYRVALRALEVSFAENRRYLSGEAARRVELSLAVLDEAIAATERALAADPESVDLRAQLRDEYQQKIDALTEMIDLTMRAS